jgi:3-hydroxyisobutyrate dehydrogenase-like beta-hydroxyacid dehydrogenase
VNNFMALTIVASIAEAFAVAAKAGVRLDKLFEVVSQGALNSPIFQMMAGGAVAGRPHAHEVRDRQRAQGHALLHAPRRVAAVPSFIGEAVHQSFEQAVALGLGDEMVPSMIEARRSSTTCRS